MLAALTYVGAIVGGAWFGLPLSALWLALLIVGGLPLLFVVGGRELARFSSLLETRAHASLTSDIGRAEVDLLCRSIRERYAGQWWRDPAKGTVVGQFTFQGKPLELRLVPTETALEIEIGIAMPLPVSGTIDSAEAPRPKRADADPADVHSWLAQRGLRAAELSAILLGAGVDRLQLSADGLTIFTVTTSLDRHRVYRQLVVLNRIANRLAIDPAGAAIQIGEICPYCRDALQEGDAVNECFSCSAKHHADCWEELGQRCAVFGCQPIAAVIAPNQR